MSRLSKNFWARPFAHRGLHDAARPENSLSAINAAVQAGYAIEIDVQPSSDGEAMVFHDYDLDRLTGETGPTKARTATELSSIALENSSDTIPTLAAVLELIGGRAPLLIEIKDQSRAFVDTDGALERRVCEVVKSSRPCRCLRYHVVQSVFRQPCRRAFAASCARRRFLRFSTSP